MKIQNMLRRSVSMFLLSLLIISFTNCKKDKDISPENEIIGEWKLTRFYTKVEGEAEATQTLTSCQKSTVYTFNEDGEITAAYKSGCDDDHNIFGGESSYFVDDNTVTLDDDTTFDLSFSGDTMTWEFVDDDGFVIRLVFTKK